MEELKRLSTRYTLMNWLTILSLVATIATVAQATIMMKICISAICIVACVVLRIARAKIKAKLKKSFSEQLALIVYDHIWTKTREDVIFKTFSKRKKFKYTINVYDDSFNLEIKELKAKISDLMRISGVKATVKINQLADEDYMAYLFGPTIAERVNMA